MISLHHGKEQPDRPHPTRAVPAEPDRCVACCMVPKRQSLNSLLTATSTRCQTRCWTRYPQHATLIKAANAWISCSWQLEMVFSVKQSTQPHAGLSVPEQYLIHAHGDMPSVPVDPISFSGSITNSPTSLNIKHNDLISTTSVRLC